MTILKIVVITAVFFSTVVNAETEEYRTALEAAKYRQEKNLSDKAKYSTNSRDRAEAKHTLEVLKNMPEHEKDALFKRAYREAAR